MRRIDQPNPGDPNNPNNMDELDPEIQLVYTIRKRMRQSKVIKAANSWGDPNLREAAQEWVKANVAGLALPREELDALPVGTVIYSLSRATRQIKITTGDWAICGLITSTPFEDAIVETDLSPADADDDDDDDYDDDHDHDYYPLDY